MHDRCGDGVAARRASRAGTADMTSDVADPTASDLGHPQRWWILVVLCLALTVIVIDNTILSVALPRLAHDLDAEREHAAVGHHRLQPRPRRAPPAPRRHR